MSKKSSKEKDQSSKQQKNNEKAAEGREIKKRSAEAKAMAAQMEEGNNSKLIAYYSGKGFRKIGGNSALFFKYVFAEQLKIDVNLRPDTDFAYKFKYGIISIADDVALKTAMESLGAKVEVEDEHLLVFDLGKKFTKEELDALKNIANESAKQVNLLVGTTKALYPEIIANERAICAAIFNLTQHLSDKRMLALNDIVKTLMRSVVDMEMMAKNAAYTPKKVLSEAVVYNERTELYLKLMMELGVIDQRKTLHLVMMLVDNNKIIKARLNDLGRNK